MKKRLNKYMQLKELIWKQFKIEDIFTVVTGANIPKNQLTIGEIGRAHV